MLASQDQSRVHLLFSPITHHLLASLPSINYLRIPIHGKYCLLALLGTTSHQLTQEDSSGYSALQLFCPPVIPPWLFPPVIPPRLFPLVIPPRLFPPVIPPRLFIPGFPLPALTLASPSLPIRVRTIDRAYIVNKFNLG